MPKRMTSRSKAQLHRPLFHAKHFFWLGHNIVRILIRAGIPLTKLSEVMDLLQQELTHTNALFDALKWRREVNKVLAEVQREQQP